MEKEQHIEKAYQAALEAYAAIGVDGTRAWRNWQSTPSPFAHRALLKAPLDIIFNHTHDPHTLKDALEAKLFGAIWDYFCLCNQVPIGEAYIAEIETYENEVLSRRD